MAEVWRDIDGYEGRYQVSSLGRVRSVSPAKPTPGRRRDGTRILARRLHRDHYAKVNLKTGRRSRTFHVHALVALAFLGPRPPKAVIDHIDGNHENDALDNLRYLSPAESNYNRKLRGNSRHSTGVACVYKHGYGGFYVRVSTRDRKSKKSIRLGRFPSLDEAAARVAEYKASLREVEVAKPRRSRKKSSKARV